MKILVCGDKHLKITRFEKSKAFLSWLNKTIEEQKPDLVVALGDDMDTHAVLRSEIMSEFRAHIDHVMNLKIPMVYVVGNHDYFKPNDTTYHAMQSFEGLYEDFTVVDKHTQLYGMDFVPYIHNHEKFPQVAQEICFAHQTFVGADYGYYRPDVGVDADKLDCSLIISGHVHKRQMFGKVIYPGTPYAHNMNDVDQEKGVMMFNTKTYDYSFIASPFAKWRSFKFDLTSECSMNDLHSSLEATINAEDNWILQLSGPKVELIAYLKTKKYLKLIKGKNITTKLSLTDNTKKNVEIKSLSMVSIVNDWVNKVYQGSIDKKSVYSKALSVIGEVDSN